MPAKAKKTAKKSSLKNSRVQVLKPLDSRKGLLNPGNIKLALIGSGILLLVLVPFVGFLLLLAAAVQHFKKG